MLGTPLKTVASYAGGRILHPFPPMVNETELVVITVNCSPLMRSAQTALTTNKAPKGATRCRTSAFCYSDRGQWQGYVGTQNSPKAYGLFMSSPYTEDKTASNRYRCPTALPASIKVNAATPYTDNPTSAPRSHSVNGGKGGSFNPVSAVTEANGNASTPRPFPKKLWHDT